MAGNPSPRDRDGDGPAGVPRWVKVSGIVGVAVAVLIVVLLLAGHGPARHTPGLGPATVAADGRRP
jgi:hypothetical protein